MAMVGSIKVAAERAKPGERAIPVGAGDTRDANDVGGENRGSLRVSVSKRNSDEPA